MDLRCRLEHNERDWLREKAELLERFDVERREWESQLRDMQRKIEELYCDVRTKREGAGLDADGVVHRLSIRSTSSGSSLFSDNEPLSSSSVSEPVRHPPVPGSGPNRSGRDGHHSTCFQADPFIQNEHPQPELVDELPSRGVWRHDSVTDSREAVDATFGGVPGCVVSQKNVSDDDENKVRPEESPLWAELSYGSDRKKNTTALNAAMKEIARVSEELCSYQDEIRKKSGDKRNQPELLCLCEESEMLLGHDKTRLEVDEAPCDLSQIYDDLRALERENWVTLSPDNTWRLDKGPGQTCRVNTADPDSYRETQTSPGLLSETDTAGPPIPPRTSSWNLSSPIHPDTELHIPESPVTTARRCHGPCVRVDKKCSSPSIVRKFEAMLQENEGKVLIDGVVATCSAPANSECNMGSCHNRWSCDASKFTNSKLSTYGTVQKSFSEVNILTARKDLCSDYCPADGNLKNPELQVPQIVKELPLDLLLSSLETPPVVPSLQGSRRNIMLEEKTAEFNRTLFQAEMGRGVKEQDGFTVADSCPGLSPTCASDDMLTTRETTYPVTTTVMDVHPEVTLSLPTSNSTTQNPNVQPRRVKCGPEGPEVRIKQEIPSEHSSQQPQIGLREAAKSSAHYPEVKHKVQTASSPSRKTQLRAATEALFSESVLPESSQPGQSVNGSTSKNENPHGTKPQSARVGVSLQQPSSENKQRQSDTSRPRMMNDHPWKALTLAAYPRPEGSRSNYGAVERILKNYESAARAQQTQSKPNETASSPNVGVGQEENVTEVDMLDMDPLPLPPTLRHTQTSPTSQMHSTHGAMCVKEVHLTVQESEDMSVSSSIQKNFSRPARPAKRRLPSRWASRSPTSSSSPSTPPAAPPSFPRQKHSSSFTLSHAFHIETVII